MSGYTGLQRYFAAKAAEQRNTETITDQGGVAHKATDATLFERFLIMGSYGTFYASEQSVTGEALERMSQYIAKQPKEALETAKRVYGENLAFRRDPVILALAALTLPSVPLDVRKAAAYFVGSKFTVGTDILHWAGFRAEMTGGKWNRLSRGVLKMYFERHRTDLELQAVKYEQRDGWAMRDLLRIGHPTVYSEGLKTLLDWIAHPGRRAELDVAGYPLLQGHGLIRGEDGYDRAPDIIRQYRLPREAVPGELLAQAGVWNALLDDMPAQALMRNLGKLSSLGLVDERTETVVQKIRQATTRLHPIQFLVTWKQYGTGHGEKGSLTWRPNPRVMHELEEGYRAAFGTLEQYENIKPLIAVDVSGSMTASAMGLNMSCIEMEICLIEVLRHQFPKAKFVAFSAGTGGRVGRTLFADMQGRANAAGDLLELDVAGKSRLQLADLIGKYSGAFLGTDCRIPLNMAMKDTSIDAVITMTDNQTGAGNPSQIVRAIQNNGRPEFKHAVLAFALNRFTIADPADVRQMDIAGASADVPRVLEYFLAGPRKPEQPKPEFKPGKYDSGPATWNGGVVVGNREGVSVEQGTPQVKAGTKTRAVDGLHRDEV